MFKIRNLGVAGAAALVVVDARVRSEGPPSATAAGKTTDATVVADKVKKIFSSLPADFVKNLYLRSTNEEIQDYLRKSDHFRNEHAEEADLLPAISEYQKETLEELKDEERSMKRSLWKLEEEKQKKEIHLQAVKDKLFSYWSKRGEFSGSVDDYVQIFCRTNSADLGQADCEFLKNTYKGEDVSFYQDMMRYNQFRRPEEQVQNLALRLKDALDKMPQDFVTNLFLIENDEKIVTIFKRQPNIFSGYTDETVLTRAVRANRYLLFSNDERMSAIIKERTENARDQLLKYLADKNVAVCHAELLKYYQGAHLSASQAKLLNTRYGAEWDGDSPKQRLQLRQESRSLPGTERNDYYEFKKRNKLGFQNLKKDVENYNEKISQGDRKIDATKLIQEYQAQYPTGFLNKITKKYLN